MTRKAVDRFFILSLARLAKDLEMALTFPITRQKIYVFRFFIGRAGGRIRMTKTYILCVH